MMEDSIVFGNDKSWGEIEFEGVLGECDLKDDDYCSPRKPRSSGSLGSCSTHSKSGKKSRSKKSKSKRTSYSEKKKSSSKKSTKTKDVPPPPPPLDSPPQSPGWASADLEDMLGGMNLNEESPGKPRSFHSLHSTKAKKSPRSRRHKRNNSHGSSLDVAIKNKSSSTHEKTDVMASPKQCKSQRSSSPRRTPTRRRSFGSSLDMTSPGATTTDTSTLLLDLMSSPLQGGRSPRKGRKKISQPMRKSKRPNDPLASSGGSLHEPLVRALRSPRATLKRALSKRSLGQ